MPSVSRNNRCGSCPDGKVEMRSTRSFGKGKFLADGTIKYIKRGWEPPPCPNGFIRNPNDAWHFLPEWPVCDFRIKTSFMKKCGALHLLIVCNCPDAPTRQQEVGVDTCKGCPFRNALQIPGTATLSVCSPSESGKTIRQENSKGTQAAEASPP